METLALAYDLTNIIVQLSILFAFALGILPKLGQLPWPLQIVLGIVSIMLLAIAALVGLFAVHSLFDRFIPDDRRAEFWASREREARDSEPFL